MYSFPFVCLLPTWLTCTCTYASPCVPFLLCAQSSALILGATATSPPHQSNNATGTTALWRVDPTGQFWNCDAAAIGRGAGAAEAWLLRRVLEYTMVQRHVTDWKRDFGVDEDAKEETEFIAGYLTSEDVRDFANGLNATDALALLQQCLVETLSSTSLDGATGSAWKEGVIVASPKRTWGTLQGVVLSLQDGSQGRSFGAFRTKTKRKRVTLDFIDECNLARKTAIAFRH